MITHDGSRLKSRRSVDDYGLTIRSPMIAMIIGVIGAVVPAVPIISLDV